MPGMYEWKHGWIPLTHAAAMKKAKGNKKAAAKFMSGKSSPTGKGTASHSETSTPPLPPKKPSAIARIDAQQAKEQYDAHKDPKLRAHYAKELDAAQSHLAQAAKYEKYHMERPAPSRDEAIATLAKMQREAAHEEQRIDSLPDRASQRAEAAKLRAKAQQAYIDARKAGVSQHDILRKHARDVDFSTFGAELDHAEGIAQDWLRKHGKRT